MMPLHEVSLSTELRDPIVEQFNARLGLVLFAIYLIAYAAFVAMSAFAPKSLDAVPAGMALIGGAMALSLVYAACCKTPRKTA